MKINKDNPHLKWYQEVWKECSHAIPGEVKLQKGLSMTNPNRKNHQDRATNGRPQGVHSISYNISTTPATQPIWNLHMLKLLIFSSERLFKTSHNFLFLHKITYLSSVELAYAFCYSLPVPNCNSCCSQINPFFAGKNNLFLRSTKVSWINLEREHFPHFFIHRK